MTPAAPSLDLARLEELALSVGREAAEAVRTSHTADHAPVHTKSSRTDIVTAVDLASEELIRRRLAEGAPGSAVLGEEGGHHRAGDGPHGDIEWVVDPLDGTVNFAYGIPLTAVSIAAVVDGQAVAGAVLDVTRGEEFTAHRGGGARVDGRPLAVGDCTDLRLALVVTGYSYDTDRRIAHGRTVAELVGQVRDVRAFGSAALQLCWVAAGRVDVYLERDIRPWDHAAGALIASEAGAAVELPCPENGDLVVAANPVLHEAVRPFLT